jgi:hypothetical protein
MKVAYLDKAFMPYPDKRPHELPDQSVKERLDSRIVTADPVSQVRRIFSRLGVLSQPFFSTFVAGAARKTR